MTIIKQHKEKDIEEVEDDDRSDRGDGCIPDIMQY